jgi:hypothetical protein
VARVKLATALMAGAVVVVALAGGFLVHNAGLAGEPAPNPAGRLLGSDFGSLRREALKMFPRGSPLAAASQGLQALGFQCTVANHLMANINAPSVQCESAGRGYPTSSRLQVTVMARNGMVSDIAIGNGFDPVVADARTPDPAPVGEGTGAKQPQAAE